jgi:ABC-type bacteriocin/lantibiotic exporter with double-glycine peptidase domain
VFAILCLAGSALGVRSAEAAGNEGMLCGPLCVTYLLRSFGRPADVDVIAAEAEWGDGRGGATMGSLVASLRRRGLSVKPLRVTPGVPFRTAVPALLHTHAADGANGHYVVLLPSAPDSVTLWDPADGVRSIPAAELATAHSGVAALVAAVPIPPGAIEPIRSATAFEPLRWYIFLVLLGGCAVITAARASRPRGVPSVS